jgi:hypothetical protein
MQLEDCRLLTWVFRGKTQTPSIVKNPKKMKTPKLLLTRRD